MTIIIQPLLAFGVTGAAPVDPDFGEPVTGQKKRYGSQFTVRGQVVYNTKDKEERTLTGDPSLGDGHLCFRRTDLEGASIVIKKGDVVKSLAGIAANYEVIEVRPSGHLRGVSNLIMVYFNINAETNPALKR